MLRMIIYPLFFTETLFTEYLYRVEPLVLVYKRGAGIWINPSEIIPEKIY